MNNQISIEDFETQHLNQNNSDIQHYSQQDSGQDLIDLHVDNNQEYQEESNHKTSQSHHFSDEEQHE